MTDKIENCMDCKHHKVINDPDPYDWFCSDDVAIVCTITSNPMRDLTAKYRSDSHENRAVTSSCRPYRMRTESDVPEWCPLLKDTGGAP